MTQLTELENHRRLITAQIKREIAITVDLVRKEIQYRIDSLDSRLQEQQRAINVITNRLMDLSLYENKLILESEKLRKLIAADKVDSMIDNNCEHKNTPMDYDGGISLVCSDCGFITMDV